MLIPRWANGRPGDGKARNSFPLGHGREGRGVGSLEMSGFGGSSSREATSPERAWRLWRARLDESKGQLPGQRSHRGSVGLGRDATGWAEAKSVKRFQFSAMKLRLS